MFRPSPLTQKRLRRFRSIKRGWWSFIFLVFLYGLSLVAELLVHHRALVVRYEGQLHFPTYGAIIPGTEFGEKYAYETDYRALRDRFRTEASGNWVLMPPVPYGPLENDLRDGLVHPLAPSWATGHWLGTDPTGRDVLARLFYGFRIVMTFALVFTVAVYVLATAIGCAMGYFGGGFDLIGQRIIEIWQNIPFLYIVIIAVTLVPADVAMSVRVGLLLLILVAFSWAGDSAFLRTATLKEKSRDYVAAVRLLGASPARIIFRHILPNTVATLVTFLPFTVAGAINSLTALDFLNFGLPRPMPSWGEMLEIGLGATHAWWIVTFTFLAITVVLLLVTFVGEAIREAFDPRRFTTYQ
jgi:microcin C transport system permease protein